jgi:urocanate hydratase
MVRRGVRPDLVTDQTSAHDLVNGYLPSGWTVAEWERQARQRPRQRSPPPRATSIVAHVKAMLDFQAAGDARPPTTATTSVRSPSTRA